MAKETRYFATIGGFLYPPEKKKKKTTKRKKRTADHFEWEGAQTWHQPRALAIAAQNNLAKWCLLVGIRRRATTHAARRANVLFMCGEINGGLKKETPPFPIAGRTSYKVRMADWFCFFFRFASLSGVWHWKLPVHNALTTASFLERKRANPKWLYRRYKEFLFCDATSKRNGFSINSIKYFMWFPFVSYRTAITKKSDFRHPNRTFLFFVYFLFSFSFSGPGSGRNKNQRHIYRNINFGLHGVIIRHMFPPLSSISPGGDLRYIGGYSSSSTPMPIYLTTGSYRIRRWHVHRRRPFCRYRLNYVASFSSLFFSPTPPQPLLRLMVNIKFVSSWWWKVGRENVAQHPRPFRRHCSMLPISLWMDFWKLKWTIKL